MDFEWTTRDEKLLVVDYWWEVQKKLCCICSEEMEPYKRQSTHNPRAATVEHLIPKRDNGPNTVGNVRLAHAVCNHALGALWEQNKHRAAYGKPLISEKEALNSARGRNKPKHPPLPTFTKDSWFPRESLYYERWMKWKDEQEAKKARGVTWSALNAVSLPRGATFLPQYRGIIEKQLRSRVARKMTAVETARWLAEQGIRGA
jgi:hypothetical protein